ncbi:MAG: hypothetical protein GY696_35615 [Gammaproteobacteria bacterium]|nr:hypothetical protein [Gammaproteobacteria bacterium]
MGSLPGLCEATSPRGRERESHRIELEVFSDASNTAGGAVVKDLRAHVMWSESEREQSSTWRELKLYFLASRPLEIGMRKGHGRLEQRRTEFLGTVPGLCEATFSFRERKRERERDRIELEVFSDASNMVGGALV